MPIKSLLGLLKDKLGFITGYFYHSVDKVHISTIQKCCRVVLISYKNN
jgi:hypothetical protein